MPQEKTELVGTRKADHDIVKRVGNSKYIISHPADCECQLIHSVRHAPWVTYNQMYGKLACDHCKTEVDMPCPSVRSGFRQVRMQIEALADDLWKFQIKHEMCPEPTKSASEPAPEPESAT